MWIKAQDGDYINSDNSCTIELNECRVVTNLVNQVNNTPEYGGAGARLLFTGTEAECERLMDDIGKALASGKRYFDVMKYFRESDDVG